MAHFQQLVRDGRAAWVRLSNGDIELTLHSGEVFHLGDQSVTRVASSAWTCARKFQFESRDRSEA